MINKKKNILDIYTICLARSKNTLIVEKTSIIAQLAPFLIRILFSKFLNIILLDLIYKSDYILKFKEYY